MLGEKVCPICKNHCSLTTPKCGRGRKYAETIELESKSNDKDKKDKDNDNKYKENKNIYKLYDYKKSDIDEKILLTLKDTSHTLKKISKGKGSQKKILVLLNEVEKISEKKLTKKIKVKSSSSSEILSEMEDKGLIKRKDSKKDKKAMDIKLTKEGKKEALLVKDQIKDLHHEMLSCLNDTEKEQFLSILGKLNLDWEKRYSI